MFRPQRLAASYPSSVFKSLPTLPLINSPFAAIDCANPQKISEKLKCKISGVKKDKSDQNDTTSKKRIFKNPFKKLNDWGKRNKTLADVVR